MSDLISRQDVLNELDVCDYELKDWQRWKLKTMVREIPSAQPKACDDAISRDDAIMAVKMGALSAATLFGRTDEGATAYYETVKAIKALPSAQSQYKKGKWIDDIVSYSDTGDIILSNCSLCGHQMDVVYEHGYFRYCPSCGARMDGESDEMQ